MYANNDLISHPLVSPILQASLGGLPPILVMVGGGEILRDEQIYLAHKCANPEQYLPPEESLTDHGREQIKKYKPTYVQLQVWDDLCHVGPTLSFTKPAKYMYRSVSQFAAWALARAQNTEIEILDDSDISVITSSGTDSDAEEARRVSHHPNHHPHQPTTNNSPRPLQQDEEAAHQESKGLVGKAGDPLPAFKNHMIRQRVTRHGVIFPLPPPSELQGCTMDRSLVGVAKQGPVKKWLDKKAEWDVRFASTKRKVHKQFVKDLAAGYEGFGAGEFPPPSALAGRRKKVGATAAKGDRKKKSIGLAMWSLWGSKHDKMTVDREAEAERTGAEVETRDGGEGHNDNGAIEFEEPEQPEQPPPTAQLPTLTSSGGGDGDGAGEHHHQPEIGLGTTGQRAYVDGIAVPFRLKKQDGEGGGDAASMVTLNSEHSQLPQSPRVSMGAPPGTPRKSLDTLAAVAERPAV